jgi:hypothetical protein
MARLNNPSAWTSKMMPHYRGMSRGFCAVTGSVGLGTGHLALLLRFKPLAGKEAALRQWLLKDLLASLPTQAGIGSAHLLEGALTPSMTNEQRIRGTDGGVDWALLVTGYSEPALSALARQELAAPRLEQQGAGSVTEALYRIDYTLSRAEIA